MKPILALWFFLGVIRLIILVYQDFKHNKKIDDRHNFFMMGATAMLITSFSNPTGYYLTLIPLVFILRYIFLKLKVMGAGDGNTVIWMFVGFGMVSPYSLIAFMLIFTAAFMVHFLFRRLLFRRKEAVQGYPIFLVSYIAAIFFVRF